MKKLLSTTLILGIVLGPAALQALAQDKLVVKAAAVAGAEGVGETAKSSKFFEYRDVPNGFIFKAFDLSLAKGNRYLTMNASRIRQRDARYGLSLGDYGKFSLDFTWDKTPHRFSFESATLYIPMAAPAAGAGVFDGSIYYYGISDEIQRALQRAGNKVQPPPDANNPQGTYAAAKALLSGFLTGVHGFELGLQRNKGTLNLSYTPTVPLSLTVDISRETRKGNRAIGASYGLNNAVEMPEPIDFVTTDVQAKVEYAKGWGMVQAGYNLSVFDNEFGAMIWDNPYRLTDQTYPNAYSNGDGTSRGQMALWPSNNANQVFFNGAVKVLKNTKITGSFSYGRFSQNGRLLPFTINTALANPIVGNTFNANQAPRATALAKANITSFDLGLNSRLLKTNAFSVFLNAGYRYYDYGNKTEPLDIPGFAVADQIFTAEAETIEPYSFMRTKAFADLSVHMVENTSFKVGYSTSKIQRRLGAEVEGAEENKSHEDTFKVSADTHQLDWLTVRVSYLSSRRKWSLDGIEVLYPIPPDSPPGTPQFNFKRYYEANRNRDAYSFLLGFSLIKNLDLELSYMLGRDKYPTTDYGLLKDDFDVYSADLTYALGQASSVYALYSHEVYTNDQASRQSGATISIDPLSDWSALFKDKGDTYGGGFNTVLVKNKLSFDLSYTYSRMKGLSSLYSPPGGSPDVAVNFVHGIDSTKLQMLKGQLLWKFTARLSIAFGYWYEQYDLDDITRNDYKVDWVVAGNGMYLGALEPGYKYHVGSVKFIYSW